MVPESGARSPASCAMSVVLPAPLGPMIACVSPSRICRSTRLVAMSPPKLLVSPRTSSSASAIATLEKRVKHRHAREACQTSPRSRSVSNIATLAQEPDEPALGEQHDEDEEWTQDQL